MLPMPDRPTLKSMHSSPLARLAPLAVISAALLVASCSKKQEQTAAQSALGEQVAKGDASDLRLTPDGKMALYLQEGQKPRIDGIPPLMLIGELFAVPTSGGGKARKLGTGVTNVPGGYSYSADSRWALFVAGYNPIAQSGTLLAADLTDASANPVIIGESVTYFLASPDSKQVAFVKGGVLSVGALPNGPFKPLSGEVQTAHFTPDSKWMIYKRKLTAAGGLFVWGTDGAKEPAKLGEQVGDLLISPDGARVAFTQRSRDVQGTYDLFLGTAPDWKVKQVAVGTGAFAFSPDGKLLGRTVGAKPEEFGNLVVGPADGSGGRELAKQVNEFLFAPTSDAVAYLDLYDISARAGLVGVAQLPDGPPKRLGSRAPNFGWSPDGKHVAFISRFLKPIYSVDLMLFTLGEKEAFKVNPGVFGYDFDPKGRYMIFRTNCLNEGRACDLMKVDLKAPRKAPVKIIEGIYTFRPSEDGNRLLVTYARRDSKLYDAAVLNVETNEHRTVGQYLQLPAVLTKSDPRVVYLVGRDAISPGVYVATKLP